MHMRFCFLVVNIVFFRGLQAQVSGDSSSAVPLNQPAEQINMTWMFFKTMGLLVLIIVLILISVYFIKKYVFNPAGPNGQSGWIRIIGQTQIQPKKVLTLVKVLDKVILLGSTDGNIRSLAEFSNIAELQPFLDNLEKNSGDWRGNRFFRLIKKNLES